MHHPDPTGPELQPTTPPPASARRGGGNALAARRVGGEAVGVRRALRAVVAVLAGCALLGASAGAASAQSATSSSAPATSLVRAAQRALGLKADGALGRRTRTAIRRFQRHTHLRVTGTLNRPTLQALGVPTASTADPATVLAAIAQCESGDDPSAVSQDGTYHGKYQFDLSTWSALGGTGDPAAAPEAEQDARAAALYAAKGITPWPVCGKQALAAAADGTAPAPTPVQPTPGSATTGGAAAS